MIAAYNKESNSIAILDILKSNSDSSPEHQCLMFYHNNRKVELTNENLYKCVFSTACRFYDLFHKFKKLNSNDVVCYLDNGYVPINQLGILITNIKVFFLSLKNSVEINYQLIKKAKSRFLVCSPDQKELIEKCINDGGIEVILSFDLEINSLIKEYDEMNKYQIINNADMEDSSERILFYMHSSGTTSLPKLVPITHNRIHSIIKRTTIVFRNVNYYNRLFSLLPIYHIYGMENLLKIIVKGGFVGYPNTFFDFDNIIRDIQKYCITSVATTPFWLMKLYELQEEKYDPNILSILSSLKTIEFGGAKLPDNILDFYVTNKIKLLNTYGSTETGLVAKGIISFDKNKINEVYICPYVDYELVPIDGEEGKYDMVIENNEMIKIDSSLCNRPNNRYSMGDMFEYVDPSNKDESPLRILGRIDDTIIHTNGEKTNPIPIENIINQNTYINKCVLVGQGKVCNALIVELNSKGYTENLVTVWKSIKNSIKLANTISPKHSMIFFDLVYILPYKTKNEIPLTSKGTINRTRTMNVFEKEVTHLLDNFYNNTEKQTNNTNINNKEDIIKKVTDLFKKVNNIDIKPNEDFFKNGLDSLTVVQLKNYINSTFNNINIKTSLIYSNTTPTKLADSLFDILNGKNKDFKNLNDLQTEIEYLLNKYTIMDMDWTSNFKLNKDIKSKDLCFLVTGANGSLGSHIAYYLSQLENVQKIYALARGVNSRNTEIKIKKSFSEKNLTFNSKIIPIAYNPNEKLLGLSLSLYENIKKDINGIYHVAWRMDFLKEVKEFEDNIQSTKELLKLSSNTEYLCVFNFISTIGAMFPFLKDKKELIPEYMPKLKIITKENCNGYNLSKMTTEHICSKWSIKYEFPLNIYRVGQVSGDTENGIWNTGEHVPLLIKSSQTMGLLPKDVFKNGMAWIPVNTAAKAICETSISDTTSKILHVANPKAYEWKIVLDYLAKENIKFKVVSNEDFIHQLKNNTKFQDPRLNPVASLTDFFESMLNGEEKPNLSTKKTSELSKDIKECCPVNEKLLKKYISYWRKIGFMQ